jgi:hypothetical protein
MDLAQDGRPERIDFRRDGRYCEADRIAKEQEPAGRNSEEEYVSHLHLRVCQVWESSQALVCQAWESSQARVCHAP